MRLVGKESQHGLPGLATVTMVQLQQGRVQQLCGGCARGLMVKKLAVALLSALLVLGAAWLAIRLEGWFIVLLLAVAGLVVQGTVYSIVDRLIWGGSLAQTLRIPGAHFPVGLRHIVLRCALLVAVGLVALSWAVPV